MDNTELPDIVPVKSKEKHVMTEARLKGLAKARESRKLKKEERAAVPVPKKYMDPPFQTQTPEPAPEPVPADNTVRHYDGYGHHHASPAFHHVPHVQKKMEPNEFKQLQQRVTVPQHQLPETIHRVRSQIGSMNNRHF